MRQIESRLRSVLCLVALAVGVGAAGCAPDAEQRVVVTVFGLDPSIRGLKVKSQLDGKPQPPLSGLRVEPQRQFALPTAPGAVGRLGIEVSGLLDDGCSTAVGRAAATLPGHGQVELVVPLERLATDQCTLTVRKLGDATAEVRSTATEIDCGERCEADIPRGGRVELRVTTAGPAGDGSHFLGWSGPCSGTGPCSVTVTGPTEVTANLAVPRVCSEHGFCWESPLPEGQALHAVWAWNDRDVWAAGDAGVLLHYDGTTWAGAPSGTRLGIYALWGRASNDIWAAGERGALLH